MGCTTPLVSFQNQAGGDEGQQLMHRGPGDSPQGAPCPCSPAVSPGTAQRPRPAPSPLELVAPQDAAVGELDDGRVRDGFVGRHRGAAGAGGIPR